MKKWQFRMLVKFRPLFVVDKKIIFSLNFGAYLRRVKAIQVHLFAEITRFNFLTQTRRESLKIFTISRSSNWRYSVKIPRGIFWSCFGILWDIFFIKFLVKTIYNHVHNILRLFDGEADFSFSTSETKRLVY